MLLSATFSWELQSDRIDASFLHRKKATGQKYMSQISLNSVKYYHINSNVATYYFFKNFTLSSCYKECVFCFRDVYSSCSSLKINYSAYWICRECVKSKGEKHLTDNVRVAVAQRFTNSNFPSTKGDLANVSIWYGMSKIDLADVSIWSGMPKIYVYFPQRLLRWKDE